MYLKELYQALYNTSCPNKEKARELTEKRVKRRRCSCYSLAHYLILGKFGGEPFFEQETEEIFVSAPDLFFPPGTTIKKVLEDLVKFGCLHKLR